jgi:hypothetical protein
MAFNDKELQIVQAGMKAGKSRQEVEKAVALYRSGYIPPEPVQQPEQKQGFFSGVKEDFNKRTNEAADAQIEAIDGKRSDISAAGRTLGAGGRFIGDIGSRTLSAVTPDPIGDMALKGVQKVAETGPAQAAMQKYQSLKQQYPELIQGLEDIGAVGGAFLGASGANIATRGALSAAEKGTSALSGITTKGAQGIKEAASKAVDPAAMMQRVARISKGKQAAFETLSGESVGQYLVKRQIFGDVDEISTQLYSRFGKSKGEVDKALDKLPGKHKNTAVGSALGELLKREEAVSRPGAVSRDLERVRELSKAHAGAGLNMTEINEVKRLYERNIRLDYLKENVPTNIERANNIDRAIRTWQQDMASQLGFKNIKDLNRETMLAKQLLDDLGAEYAGSAGNNAVTLTDWILLAGTSADPATAIGSFIAKRTLGSKKVMSKIAEVFSGGKNVPDPKAAMSAPTIDNYLNFLKKSATDPNIDIDTPIKNYVKDAQPGLSVKELSPESVARKIDKEDALLLNNFKAHHDQADTFIRTEPLLEQIGINKFPLEDQLRFITETLDLWNER